MLKDFNKRFLIVDGSHYLYRAYYGVPESARLPNGLKVNAVYGFLAQVFAEYDAGGRKSRFSVGLGHLKTIPTLPLRSFNPVGS